MIRSLTVFYLHKAGRLDSRRLPVVEYGLNDAFRDFCRETFDTDAPLDYPPLIFFRMQRMKKSALQWEKLKVHMIL